MEQLAQRAIRAALRGDWTEAEKLNRKILKEDSKDIDALNRLARAQTELGKTNLAKQTYQKALKLDPYNTIAQKGLERVKRLKKIKRKRVREGSHAVETSFLEEPGKTKVVSLIHLGDESVVNDLDTGEIVKLVPRRHRVSVEAQEGKYIGRLPDDLSRRIIKFTRAGNEYKALVRSTNEGKVKIFIREVKRAPSLSDIPSFPTENADYVSFTPPELLYEERPEVTTLEEEEEEG